MKDAEAILVAFTSGEWVALIAALTALCAVLLGPLVLLRSATLQSRVAVLSTNRQAWINTLRDAVAECLSLSGTLSLHRDREIRHGKIERISFATAKIRLMLNPNETEHQLPTKAVVATTTAAARASSSNATDADYVALQTAGDKVFPAAQQVLKTEWERAKKFK